MLTIFRMVSFNWHTYFYFLFSFYAFYTLWRIKNCRGFSRDEVGWKNCVSFSTLFL
jgi:hypothetical protein